MREALLLLAALWLAILGWIVSPWLSIAGIVVAFVLVGVISSEGSLQ